MEIPSLEALRREFVEDSDHGVSAVDFDRLCRECGSPPDRRRLKRYLRRRQLGEPVEYILGFQWFRGQRFLVDKRVYITDSELTHLVDAVVSQGREVMEREKRSPVILEFGVGCGSLSISIKKELPEARVFGIDLDSDAMAVALQNQMLHHVDVCLMESDFFADVPPEIVPDIVFGDPPWGDQASVYDDERPAAHYQAMPLLSAFPVGGITAVHESLLEDVRQRGWNSSIFLNLGILEDRHVERLTGLTERHERLRFGEVSVLHAKMQA